MTLDRALFKSEFSATLVPRWPCPSCTAGRLKLRPGSLQEDQTVESRRASQHPAWEPEWVDGRFACLFECTECGNVVSSAGKYRMQDERHWDEQLGESGDYEAYYKPYY